jgi:hypothetical protein
MDLARLRLRLIPMARKSMWKRNSWAMLPAKLKLAAGSRIVDIEAVGFAEWKRTLEILKDSQVTRKAVLEPVPWRFGIPEAAKKGGPLQEALR